MRRTDATAIVPALSDAPSRMPLAAAVAWALLLINTLGSQGAETLLPIPRGVIQAVAMGALAVAFVLALLVNRNVRVSPSSYLFLLTAMLIVSLASSTIDEPTLGGMFRVGRFAIFVVTLWLLSRWWSDSITFVRYHVRTLVALLVPVALGIVASPGLALPEETGGRLVGVLWPLTPTQVGQYSAVAAGLAIVLWLCRLADGRSVAVVSTLSITLLVLSHTRTAALGLLVGVGVAAASLLLTTARARKAILGGILFAGFAAVALGSAIQLWILRGQTAENFANLTGREKVWDALLGEHRTWTEELIGVGLTDKSFNGLPIDSSWLAVYHEQGIVGVTIVALFLGTLVVAAVLRPPSPQRACAIFLIVYCLIASYTEAGLGDASPYLLYLALAAALLSTPQQAVEGGIRR